MDELIAQAELGEAARGFVLSELGKVMIGMARQDAQEASDALSEVDPTDVEKIRSLQNKAKLGRNFEQYLAELVTRGDQALVVFQQQTQGET